MTGAIIILYNPDLPAVEQIGIKRGVCDVLESQDKGYSC